MDAVCPVCKQTMSKSGDHYHCAQGHGDFQQEVVCPQCHRPLEVLKACGAVDYFCLHGHGLISKMRVEICYIPC